MTQPLIALDSPALWALLGYAGWALFLVTLILVHRTSVVLAGRRRANSWPRGNTPAEEPAIMVRVRDAHLNTVEHLPVFIAVVIVAAASDRLAVIDPLAPLVLGARLAQSLTHLVGTTHTLVFLRASFFSVQLGLIGYMMVSLLR